MSGIVAAISWMVGKMFADNVLRWIAFKGVMVIFFVLVLPIIFNNLIYDVIQIMFTFVSSKVETIGLGSSVQSVTGVAGWLIIQCKISESLSVILGAVAMRVSLNFIPFTRV